MSKKVLVILSALLLISNATSAQSLLNAAQALEGAQAIAAPAPSLTDQVENAAEQKLLQAAPAPVQETVQTYQQAQQVKALGSAIVPATGSSLAPSASGAVLDNLENNVKQNAAQDAVNLLK